MSESQTGTALNPQSLSNPKSQAVTTTQSPDQVASRGSLSTLCIPETTAKAEATVAKAKLGALVEWLPLMSFLASVTVFVWASHGGRSWAFAVILLAASILFLMINNESKQQSKKD